VLIILLGIAVMILCLAVQGGSVGLVIYYYARATRHPLGARPYVEAYGQLVRIMVLLLFAGMLQMGAWAMVFRMLGQFEDFETALYFSGVTFTSLGYGDLTLPKRLRILSAMEAADGLMMFGVISAVFMQAMQHALTRVRTWYGEHAAAGGSGPLDR
jgi:hypothetical protein